MKRPLGKLQFKTIRSHAGRSLFIGIAVAWYIFAFPGIFSSEYSAWSIQSLSNPWFWAATHQLIALTAMICFKLGYRQHYLSQLPWTEAWPWIVTVLLGPVGWIVMLFSYPLYRRASSIEGHQSLRAALKQLDDGESPPPHIIRSLKSNTLVSYPSDPETARTVYQTIRSAALSERESRLQELDQYIASSTKTMQHYADSLKSLRQQRSELTDEEAEDATHTMQQYSDLILIHRQSRDAYQAERRQLLALPPNETDEYLNDPATITAEFDQIMDLPGVIAAQVVDVDEVRFVIRSTYYYGGDLYDLGDWCASIKASHYSIQVNNLRNAVQPEWTIGSYPSYGHSGGHFCFGGRGSQIDEHFGRRQYLEAMALVVAGLSSVNRKDEHKLPQAFYSVH